MDEIGPYFLFLSQPFKYAARIPVVVFSRRTESLDFLERDALTKSYPHLIYLGIENRSGGTSMKTKKLQRQQIMEEALFSRL